jgi:phospholipid/cholesterol/gamma-HCH transport system permease protein
MLADNLAGVGRTATAALSFVGDSLALLVELFGHLGRGRLGWRRLLAQMAVVGPDSLSIALITLLFAGMVFGLHTSSQMVRFGMQGYVGGMVALTVAREMGPVLTGIVVAARVGSAFAAEIGTMVVTEQVDALRALATSPTRYLVLPRTLACVVVLPLLTLVADFAGGLGGYVIARLAGVSSAEFLASAQQWLGGLDLFGGLAKSLVFGGIIALVGCRQGLRTQGGAAGVGRATTSAVVLSIVLIYVSNYFLSAFIYHGWQPV